MRGAGAPDPGLTPGAARTLARPTVRRRGLGSVFNLATEQIAPISRQVARKKRRNSAAYFEHFCEEAGVKAARDATERRLKTLPTTARHRSRSTSLFSSSRSIPTPSAASG